MISLKTRVALVMMLVLGMVCQTATFAVDSAVVRQIYTIPQIEAGQEFDIMFVGGDMLPEQTVIDTVTVINENVYDGIIEVTGILNEAGLQMIRIGEYNILIEVMEPTSSDIVRINF